VYTVNHDNDNDVNNDNIDKFGGGASPKVNRQSRLHRRADVGICRVPE